MVMLRIYFCVFCFGLLGCKKRNAIQSNRNMPVQIDTINLENSEQFYCGDSIYEDRLFFKKMKDISYFKNLRRSKHQITRAYNVRRIGNVGCSKVLKPFVVGTSQVLFSSNTKKRC